MLSLVRCRPDTWDAGVQRPPASAALQAFSSGRYCSEGERDALLTQITRQPSAPWSTASNWSFRCTPPPPPSLSGQPMLHATSPANQPLSSVSNEIPLPI